MTYPFKVGRQGLRVHSARVLRGPHLFSNLPMICIDLDLRALEIYPTDRLPGFVDALLAQLPELEQHGCSYAVPGGFVRRLREGTWLGHVAEHVALALQNAVGNRVTHGKTRGVRHHTGRYHVMYTFVDELVGLAAGRLALELIADLLPAHLAGLEGPDLITGPASSCTDGFEAGLQELRSLATERALGPTTRSLVQEADRRGIPWRRLDTASLILFGQGRHQKRVRASCTDFTSSIATGIASDKVLTKSLLAASGLPVPKGELVLSAAEACAAAQRIGYPVVTKPLDGNHGRGVSCDLTSPEQVLLGFKRARAHSRQVIVEQRFAGADHRILVIGGQVAAVAERIPAHVVGDGRATVQALIEAVNRDTRRGTGHSSPLTRIDIDEVVLDTLHRAGHSLQTIPRLAETVILCPTANLSTGGVAIDRTGDIHPDNALMARRAAAIVGLDVAGIDFICPDIRRSVLDSGGGIIEVNAGPGFRMHLEPFEGRPRNVARPVLDLLFPEGSSGRIPILAITGTNGKSTTVRMLGHILECSGLTVGLTSTTGVHLNGRRVVNGDCSGPRSARLVLQEPGVDVAVLECARGGILREGLAFDRCDIGAVLNVAEDHLGLRGINTLDDLAAVKSVVTESVRRGGWSILNADNEPAAALANRARGRICYFSLRDPAEWPVFLKDHVAKGGRAICRETSSGAGDIVMHDDKEAIFLMKVGDIPATFQGWAQFNTANALAAIAMAYCQGVAPSVIRDAMESFTTSFEQSPGRMNVFDAHGFRTILDYCHNPDGLREIGKLLAKMRPDYNRTLGLFGSPGDRRDCDILEMGALASKTFDILVFREDRELRGRAPGSIAGLLRQGAVSAGCAPDRIHIALNETDAIDTFLQMARPRDLLLMTADDVWAAWQKILEFEPGYPQAASAGTSAKLHVVAN